MRKVFIHVVLSKVSKEWYHFFVCLNETATSFVNDQHVIFHSVCGGDMSGTKADAIDRLQVQILLYKVISCFVCLFVS